MNSVLAALKGRKTYIVVAAFLLCVAIEKLAGIDIPGFNVEGNWLEMTLAMLGLGTLRAGIAGK
jgi:hypothetical protein